LAGNPSKGIIGSTFSSNTYGVINEEESLSQEIIKKTINIESIA
jgi:hypothetical protein